MSTSSRMFGPAAGLLGLLGVALAAQAVAGSAASFLPGQLHCSSIVYLFRHTKEAGVLLSYDTTTLEHYQVEEFVELAANRSAVLLHEASLNSVQIFYNKLVPDAGAANRKLIAYEPQKRSCRSERIGDWPLAELRAVAISLHNDQARPLDNENAQHVDVSIGPSGLLYSVEDNRAAFRFRGSLVSQARMTVVDVYTRQYLHEAPVGYQYVTMVVHVLNAGRRRIKLEDSLADLYEADGGAPVNIGLIGACKTTNLGKPKQQEQQGFWFDDHTRMSEDAKTELQLDADTFCERDSTLFVVHYAFVAAHSPGTLIGRSLEELGEGRYEFQREPFAQPTGIGCWSALEDEPEWELSLTRNNPMESFSAEWRSDFGDAGLSFVAYNREQNLLRLDRKGRKSVYDLAAGKSYHVGEFCAAHDAISPLAWKTSAKTQPKPLDRCVALDISSSSQLSKGRGDVVAQLIGLRRGQGDERHLGSRMVDHVNYEVFERELKLGSPGGADERLPVLVQMARSRLPSAGSSQAEADQAEQPRFFLTYYAQSIAELSGPKVAVEAATAAAAKGAQKARDPLLLSYIELWQFEPVRGQRRLLNRVEFSQFSWQLDVEPSNDPASQQAAGGGGAGGSEARLFELAACYQERAAQAELVVDFKRDADKAPLDGGLLVEALRVNQRQLHERVHRLLAQALEVSRLNLVDLQVRPLEATGDLIATTRLVELQSSLLDRRSLGFGRFSADTFDAHLVRALHNRHSLEECQLDSIAWPADNWIAHCQGLAVCLLLKPDDQLKASLRRDALTKEEARAPEVKADLCYVYAFKAAPLDAGRMGRRALRQAELSYWSLPRRALSLELANGGAGGEPRRTYVAVPQARELKQLDSIGGRLTNEAALLAGLRYSTTAEEPGARNLNSRALVPRHTQMGPFRFCQLACQMDDQCGSFSLCPRASTQAADINDAASTKRADDDCVLSSVRLSAERLNMLIDSSNKQRQAEKFEVKVTSERESQVLMMFHDPTCSIHPKDFAAEYELAKTFINAPVAAAAEADKQAETPLVEKLETRRLSLDDCASLSFERNLFADPNLTNFTYCPLESRCVVAGDQAAKRAQDLPGYCYLYRRRLTHAYQLKRMTHMVVAPAPAQDGGGGGVAVAKTPAKKLDPIEEAERMAADGLVVRKFWSLGEQKCASECNMRRSKCLAFDTCRQSGRTLCVLFAIRSPLARQSAYLPQLELERSANARALLVNNMICDHHYLRADYFEVRLKHLWQQENGSDGQDSAPASKEAERNAEKEKLVGELESAISAEDKRASEAALGELERELEREKAAVGTGALEGASAQGRHANKWVHFGALLAGLLLGAVATLYREPIAGGLAASYRFVEARRRARADGEANSQLVLEEPFG